MHLTKYGIFFVKSKQFQKFHKGRGRLLITSKYMFQQSGNTSTSTSTDEPPLLSTSTTSQVSEAAKEVVRETATVIEEDLGARQTSPRPTETTSEATSTSIPASEPSEIKLRDPETTEGKKINE